MARYTGKAILGELSKSHAVWRFKKRYLEVSGFMEDELLGDREEEVLRPGEWAAFGFPTFKGSLTRWAKECGCLNSSADEEYGDYLWQVADELTEQRHVGSSA